MKALMAVTGATPAIGIAICRAWPLHEKMSYNSLIFKPTLDSGHLYKRGGDW